MEVGVANLGQPSSWSCCSEHCFIKVEPRTVGFMQKTSGSIERSNQEFRLLELHGKKSGLERQKNVKAKLKLLLITTSNIGHITGFLWSFILSPGSHRNQRNVIATDVQINSREQSHVREQLVIWLKHALDQAAHRMQRPTSRADASCKRQLRDVALFMALKQKLLSRTSLQLHLILIWGQWEMTGMIIRSLQDVRWQKGEN